jgi:hypothetical protein
MPGPVIIARSPTGENLHVKYHVALELQFPDDERSIIQTLEVLKSQVANTLQAFKSEFRSSISEELERTATRDFEI